MSKFTKALSLFLALTMVVLLGACGNSSTKESDSEMSTKEEPVSSSMIEKKEPESAATTNKPTTITVEIYDRSNTPDGLSFDDHFLTHYIEDNFTKETQIAVEFVPIPRSGDDDKIQVLMASDSAPDICFSYDSGRYYSYAGNDGLAEITDEMLNTNAPNLKKFLGDELLEYGKYKGVQYSIPAKRAITATHSSHIRKDLLDALEIPMPTTVDEFYDALKQIQEKDPAGIGTENIIPFGMHGSTVGTNNMNYLHFLHAFLDPDMSREDFYTLPWELQPGGKDGLRFLNKMYNEGMISRDFALDDSGTQFEQDAVTGKIVFFGCNGDPYDHSDSGINGIQKVLESNIPGAQFHPVETFQNSAGQYPKTKYVPYGMFIFFPRANSENTPQALQYLDWMSKPENLTVIQHGLEGVHYDMVDGLPVIIEENLDQRKIDLWKSFDLGIITNGVDLGSEEKNIEYEASRKRYPDLSLKSHEQSLNDAYTVATFDRPIESEIKYGPALSEVVKELVIKSIMSAPEEFDSTYDAIHEKWLEEGGQQVIDEKLEALKDMKE